MRSSISRAVVCATSLLLSGCNIDEVRHNFRAETVGTKTGELRFLFINTDYFEKYSVLRGNPYKIKVNLYSDKYYRNPTVADALKIHLHYKLFQGDKLVYEKNIEVVGEKNIILGNVRLFNESLPLEYADHRIDVGLQVFDSSGKEVEKISTSVPVKYTYFEHSGPPLP